jgi:hypothetical protein
MFSGPRFETTARVKTEEKGDSPRTEMTEEPALILTTANAPLTPTAKPTKHEKAQGRKSGLELTSSKSTLLPAEPQNHLMTFAVA